MRILCILFLLIDYTFCWAQREIGEITNAYNEYQQQYAQVRVHLELNQPKYSPGDTIYFKSYFLSFQFQPLKGNHFITLQLLNGKGNIVHLQNVMVEDGKSSNQLIIPEQLPPGAYLLEAYNDWMKNFDDRFYFRKKIEIVGRRKLIATKPLNPVPSIHIEGGHLVGGIPNNVVIIGPKNKSGILFNENKGSEKPFTLDDYGLGRLFFTPEQGSNYRVKIGSSTNSSPSYSASHDGISIQVTSLGECSPLQLQCYAPQQSVYRNKELFLITTAYGSVTYAKVFTLTETDATSILIPYRSLHDGLNQIYLMTQEGEVIAERIYFLSPMYSQVELEMDNRISLQPRDSAEIKISLTDFFGNPIKGEFSVSVINQKLFEDGVRSPSLRNSLYLFNDLPALGELYEANDSPESLWMKNINDWLITQKWERSNWSEILSVSSETKKMIPYKHSLSIKGRIVSEEDGTLITDSCAVSFFQANKKIVYSTYSNSKGEFDLPLINDFANVDRFYYKVEPVFSKTKLKNYKIESDALAPLQATEEVIFADAIDPYGAYTFNKRIIDHSYQTYLNRGIEPVQQRDTDPNQTFLNALSGEDIEIIMSDYILFPTVEDLIHEVVSGLQVRRSGGVPGIKVPIFSGGYTRIPTGEPLYIINGIFTLDTQKFLELNPEKLVYLKIVNEQSKLSKFGSFGSHGVVVVLTQQPVSETTLNSKFFALPGINQQIPFYTGELSDSFRIPKLRGTLHWNPAVTNGFNGKTTIKLKLTDDLGPMRVSVSGVTFDGSPFSNSILFEVKKPDVIHIN